MIVEGVHGLMKVGSDHSMDSCPISTQGNSANMDLIREAMERSNPWTNKHLTFIYFRKSALDLDPEAQAVMEMMGKTFVSKDVRAADEQNAKEKTKEEQNKN